MEAEQRTIWNRCMKYAIPQIFYPIPFQRLEKKGHRTAFACSTLNSFRKGMNEKKKKKTNKIYNTIFQSVKCVWLIEKKRVQRQKRMPEKKKNPQLHAIIWIVVHASGHRKHDTFVPNAIIMNVLFPVVERVRRHFSGQWTFNGFIMTHCVCRR